MKRIHQELASILAEVVERQAFLFGGVCEGGIAPEFDGEVVDARIRYRKDSLLVRLVCTIEFARELSANMRGEEGGEEFAAGSAEALERDRLALDAVGETLNTLLGNYLYQFMYPYDTRDLSTPESRLARAAEVAEEVKGLERVALLFEERHPVRLYVIQSQS